MAPSTVASATSSVKLSRKTVDFRKEKAVIRDLAYLVGEDTVLILKYKSITKTYIILLFVTMTVLFDRDSFCQLVYKSKCFF